jgi:WD40 repeat protein
MGIFIYINFKIFWMKRKKLNFRLLGTSNHNISNSLLRKDVTAMCLTFNDEFLVSGSSDSEIIVWDPSKCQLLKTFNLHKGN